MADIGNTEDDYSVESKPKLGKGLYATYGEAGNSNSKFTSISGKGLYSTYGSGNSSGTQLKSTASDFKEVGRQVLGSFVAGLPEMEGQALQAFSPEGSTVHNIGKKLESMAVDNSKDFIPDLENRGEIAQEFIKAGSQVAPSVAGITGAAAATALGAPVAVAAGLSSLGTAALFGGSSKEVETRAAKAKGLSDEEANKLGIISGLIQGGGEAVANALNLKMLGLGGNVARELITGTASASTLKSIVKTVPTTLIKEGLTEAAQDTANEVARKAYGVGGDQGSLTDIAKASFKGGVTLSAILAPFGLAGHYKNAKQVRAINEVLDNPQTSPTDRQAIVAKLYNDAKASGVKGVDAWYNKALTEINSNLPISRTIDDKADPLKNETFAGTKEVIANTTVKDAYNKFTDTFNKIKDANDEGYKSTLTATISSLDNVISKDGANPLEVQEAKQAKDEILQAHESRLRTDKAEADLVKEQDDQDNEVLKEVTAPTVEEAVATEAAIASEEVDKEAKQITGKEEAKATILTNDEAAKINETVPAAVADKPTQEDRRLDPSTRKEYATLLEERLSHENRTLQRDLDAANTELRTSEVVSTPDVKIPNKKAFLEQEAPAYVASIDIDSLKYINDKLGHAGGDALLKSVAQTLRKHSDAYHVSGDELFVRGESQEQLESSLNAALAELQSGKTVISEGKYSFDRPGFSYGIAKVEGEIKSSMKAADIAMLANKRAREAAGERAGRGKRPKGFKTIRIASNKVDVSSSNLIGLQQLIDNGTLNTTPKTLKEKQTTRDTYNNFFNTKLSVKEVDDVLKSVDNIKEETTTSTLETLKEETIEPTVIVDIESKEDSSINIDEVYEEFDGNIVSEVTPIERKFEGNIETLNKKLNALNRNIIELKQDGLDVTEDLAERKVLEQQIDSIDPNYRQRKRDLIKKSAKIVTQESLDEDGDATELLFDYGSSEEEKITVENKHSIFRPIIEKLATNMRASVISDGLQVIYAEDFATFNWKGIGKKLSQELKFAKGLYTKVNGKPYVLVNGNRLSSVEELVGTFAHELIGHYGLRKLFTNANGTNEYEQFLRAMLKNSDGGKLVDDIMHQAEPWSSYLTAYKRKNIPDYNLMDPKARNMAYEMHLRSLQLPNLVYYNSYKDGKKTTARIPLEVAVRFADEYLAEVAKEKFLQDTWVSEKIGFGAYDSTKRQAIRKERDAWYERLLTKIKHLLKKMFGGGFDPLTREDLTNAIAASADSIFEELNPDYKSRSPKPFVNTEIPTYEVEELDFLPEEFNYDLAPEDTRTNIINGFIKNEAEFSKAFLSNTGDLKDTARGRLYKKMDEAVRNNPITRAITTFGNMRERDLYKAITTIGKGHVDTVERATQKFSKNLQGLNPLQNQLMFEFFTTKGYDINSIRLTPVQKEAAVEAKQAIRDMGKFLADIGVISKESFEKNEDAYLHTQYLKYIKQYRGSGKKVSALSFTKEKKSRTELEDLALGKIRDVSFLAAETYGVMSRDVVLLEMFNSINKMSAMNKLHWVLTGNQKIKYGNALLSIEEAYIQKDRSRFILSETEKNQNAFYAKSNITKMELESITTQLEQDLARLENQFIQEAYNHAIDAKITTAESKEKFLLDNYVKMPEKKQLGALAGRYVRKEIANDLEAFTSSWTSSNQNNVEKFLSKGGGLERINKFWKTSMVGLNIPSWVRNFFGNFALLDLSTSTNKGKLTGMVFDEAYNSIKGTPSPEWELARRYGLFGTTFSAVEMQDIYAGTVDEFEKAQAAYKARSHTSWDEALHFADERIAPVLAVAYHKTNAKLSTGFSWLEGVFKTVAMKDYINRWEDQNSNKVSNLPETEREVIYAKAAKHANDAIFDYSQVPGWVGTLRSSAIGIPFITFTYKAAPLAVKAMVNNPIKFAQYATLPYMMTMISAMVNDWDDDDISKMKEQLSDYQRLNSGTMFLPFRDSLGRPQVLPLDYIIPWSQYTTTARKIYENFKVDGGESPVGTAMASIGTATKELGLLGGPTPDVIAAFLTGKDSFTGRDIMTPGASGDTKMRELMTYAANLIVPSWVNSHGSLSKIWGALGDPEVDRLGNVKLTPGQAISTLAGFGASPVIEDTGRANRVISFEKRIKDANMYRAKIAKDRNLDPQERALKIKEVNERIKNIRRQQFEATGP